MNRSDTKPSNRPIDLPKIAVVIPAKNEAATIGGIVRRIGQLLPQAQVVVIDDASTDATGDIAAKAGATVLRHLKCMNYGTAIQTGYKFAWRHNFDSLVQLDGDGQHEPEDIPQLVSRLSKGDCDIVFGSRFLGAQNYHLSAARKMGIFFFRLLLYLFTGRRISDPTTGFQAMNRRVLSVFVQDLFPADYPDADVILLLDRLGLRFTEIPVRMYQRNEGRSMHSSPVHAIYYLFKMIISMFLTRFRRTDLHFRPDCNAS